MSHLIDKEFFIPERIGLPSLVPFVKNEDDHLLHTFEEVSYERYMNERLDIHEAKTHLSKLVEQAGKGEPFVIAKAGKPLVKVVPYDTPAAPAIRRLGFLGGQFTIPDDFDRMGESEIERLFASA